jgi:protein TonB
MARKKRKVSRIYIISLAAHLLVGGAIALIPQEQLREVVAIALNEAPPPKHDTPPPPPPKPAAQPVDRPARTARAPRTAAAEPAAATADSNARAAVFTDLGLTLDSSSSDGIAVPMAPKVVAPVAPPPVATKPKLLIAKRTEPECIEALVKPRPLALVRPSYTEDARRARVEGRLRIELAVNDQGQVTNAKVLDSLGHGLDEAALAAARDLHFAPATHCRKPVSAPFVIAMRFVLGS